MTTDETGVGTITIEGVAGNAYHVTDGTVVATVETRDGSRVELRMGAESARGLAAQLQEQARLLEAHRADAGPREDDRDIIGALSGSSPDVSAGR